MIRQISGRIGVMYRGRMVESGDTDAVGSRSVASLYEAASGVGSCPDRDARGGGNMRRPESGRKTRRGDAPMLSGADTGWRDVLRRCRGRMDLAAGKLRVSCILRSTGKMRPVNI